MPRSSRESFKTLNDVFDLHTERVLFVLISKGFFEALESPISIGKEANVFSAIRRDGSRVAVKIYRLETCDFNRMYEYIREDPRFDSIRRQRREIIFAWCRREYRNLLKARQAGIRVPVPITFSKNVLVVEFIGNQHAAPKVKDALPEDTAVWFQWLCTTLRSLNSIGMVHGDLSEYNILNHDNQPVVIDWSHGMPIGTQKGKELFARDCRNIASFFQKLGIKDAEKRIMECAVPIPSPKTMA